MGLVGGEGVSRAPPTLVAPPLPPTDPACTLELMVYYNGSAQGTHFFNLNYILKPTVFGVKYLTPSNLPNC